MRPTFLQYLAAAGLDRLGLDFPDFHTRAAVSPAVTTDAAYEALDGLAEFRTFLARKLLPSRIEAIARVPFNVPVPFQDGVASAYWRGEGQPRPITAFSADAVKLPPRQVDAVSVVTEELLERAGRGTDGAITRILASAAAARVNATFLSADAAVSGVSPAGIAVGAGGITATSSLAADLSAVVKEADDDDVDLSRAVWILSPAKAVAAAAALGTDKLGLRGGELLGAPALTDPAAGATVYLLVPNRIALAIGSAVVTPSREATVEMSDSPTPQESVAADTVYISVWQLNMTGFLTSQPINWQALAGGVYTITPSP
jgi:hypothetical protein